LSLRCKPADFPPRGSLGLSYVVGLLHSLGCSADIKVTVPQELYFSSFFCSKPPPIQNPPSTFKPPQDRVRGQVCAASEALSFPCSSCPLGSHGLARPPNLLRGIGFRVNLPSFHRFVKLGRFFPQIFFSTLSFPLSVTPPPLYIPDHVPRGSEYLQALHLGGPVTLGFLGFIDRSCASSRGPHHFLPEGMLALL